jgi:hypothetical protein
MRIGRDQQGTPVKIMADDADVFGSLYVGRQVDEQGREHWGNVNSSLEWYSNLRLFPGPSSIFPTYLLMSEQPPNLMAHARRVYNAAVYHAVEMGDCHANP